MDHRTELKAGTVLPFPGMECMVEGSVGRGSNSLVYAGSYPDAMNPRQRHRVLIKELFPYDAQGHIWRDERQRICRDAKGEDTWQFHRLSFERGNDTHLRLLAQRPDQIGGNLNTFELNGTLYTLLDDSGSRSLEKELTSAPAQDMQTVVRRMLGLLSALDTFHARGLIHLDISMDNVLLIGEGEGERVMLIDYNSVHTLQELRHSAHVYFSAKEGFTAPEVRTGMTQAIGPCTDLFSVTAVLYTCLMGQPPTMAQLSRKRPPDASDSWLLVGAASTVRSQVSKIMRRGLCVLPDRRYQSCEAMRRDLQELLDRLNGVGVTHAALWEAGRRSMHRLAEENPSLAYIRREAELYPLRIAVEGGGSAPAGEFMQGLASGEGSSLLLVGEGGMGKSTALMRTVLTASDQYDAARPAVIYLPLLGWRSDEGHDVLSHILQELRFDTQTRTLADARHVLRELLEHRRRGRGGERPTLLLLLDGLNEVAGDTAELIGELNALHALPGLCMVVTSRVAPEGLRMPCALMVPLEEQDVSDALARHGLLLPESDAMRQMLRTPMMLSMFIETAKGLESQVFCRTERELLQGYLDALCRKVSREERYQAEAAVRFVLPAMAREIARQGQPLNDQALLKTVERCYRALGSRAMLSAFPEWIGHSGEILCDRAAGSEVWYGQIVQGLLWRRLGLLVRDEAGCYHIRHQILRDDLVTQAAENDRRLRRQRARGGAAAAAMMAVILLLGGLVYHVWIKPKAYDAAMSERVIDAAVMQFVQCGRQYESMTALLSGAIAPETCLEQVAAWGKEANRSALTALSALRESDGQVVPWSGKPIDLEQVAALLVLPQERAVAYPAYVRAYELVLAGETNVSQSDFTRALEGLLEADADIAWLLDQLICVPHVAAMNQEQRLIYDAGMLALPQAQETRTVDVSRGTLYALEKAYERQREAQRELSQMPVMYDPRVVEDTV